MVENIEQKCPVTVSGRDIIQEYLQGKPLATQKYSQMTKAMANFVDWQENSKIDFLNQFMAAYDLLDANCSEMVSQFCSLKWHSIPESLLQSFVDFLTIIAVNHVNHIEIVFRSLTLRFIPELEEKVDAADSNSKSTIVPAFSDEHQERVYKLAHDSIKQIIYCVPLAIYTLIKCCNFSYPYYRHSTTKLLGYQRNLILLSENFPSIAKELWSMIFDRLIQLDASIAAKRQCEERNLYDTEEIFLMDEDSKGSDSVEVSNVDSLESRLDLLMAQLLQYIGSYFESDDAGVQFLGAYKSDLNYKWIDTLAQRNLNIYGTMLAGFEEHVLYSFDIQSMSYLWFYLCSFDKKICKAMLNFLWEIVRSPQRSPNDWKKAHNAAALICGFLARADYINFKTASAWLKTMAEWCCTYVDNAGTLKVNTGSLQHGTFYATVQSLLFVLCYRYREFHGVEEIHLWGLSRIVHSKLEPLRFISQAVALCFANVSRHLQIVYCNHIICSDEALRRRPVELYFPFSFCTLNICSSKILPLMRKFTPMDELAGVASSSELFGGGASKQKRNSASDTFEDADMELNHRRAGVHNVDDDEDDYDFMDGASYKSDKIKSLLESISRSPLMQFSAMDTFSP